VPVRASVNPEGVTQYRGPACRQREVDDDHRFFVTNKGRCVACRNKDVEVLRIIPVRPTVSVHDEGDRAISPLANELYTLVHWLPIQTRSFCLGSPTPLAGAVRRWAWRRRMAFPDDSSSVAGYSLLAFMLMPDRVTCCTARQGRAGAQTLTAEKTDAFLSFLQRGSNATQGLRAIIQLLLRNQDK
jgi:hypothetical protein